MADTTEQAGAKQKPELTAEERALNKAQKILAHTLWIVDNKDAEFPDQASRKAAFGEARKSYVQKSKKLMKTLKSKGVEFSLSPAADKAADEADEG